MDDQYINQSLYPNEFNLHQKYAKTPQILDLVWTHCNIVAEITLQLIDQGQINQNEVPRDVTLQAALLHDIGVYLCGGFEWIPDQPPAEKPYIQHTVVGAWILQQEGYPAPIVQAAYIHTGVGLTAQDITMYGLDLPQEDFMPRTTMQKLITYAAKFHSKAPKFRTIEEITSSLAKYGEEKVNRFVEFQTQFGIPDLTGIQAKYSNWHQGFTFTINQASQPTMGTNGVSLQSSGVSK